jgi:hypothetical protein
VAPLGDPYRIRISACHHNHLARFFGKISAVLLGRILGLPSSEVFYDSHRCADTDRPGSHYHERLVPRLDAQAEAIMTERSSVAMLCALVGSPPLLDVNIGQRCRTPTLPV